MKNSKKIVAKKSLGQNFLINKGVLEIIIKESELAQKEIALEIGPGKGALTEALLRKADKVLAIEKDGRLINPLNEKFSKEILDGKLQIICADALDFDYKILKKLKYKVIANIPYYITGAIIKKFLTLSWQPDKMVLMVQKEVAKRIVAVNKKESLLSLSVKAYGKPKYVKTISRGSFSPIPKVDSAILSIESISKKNFKEVTEENFFKILRAGFSSKRKFLLKNLKPIYGEKIDKVFSELKINKKIRAEDLELENWIHLAKKI